MEPDKPVSSQLPRHVAIIMDGNGRWAKQRNQARHAGHRAGVEATRAIIEYCVRTGIPCLTLFAFSSENWQRPKHEVSLLMELFVQSLKRETDKLNSNGVCVRFIGDRSAFSARLQKQITETEQITQENTALTLNIAANYGGRWDITQAARAVAQQVENGELTAAEFTEQHLTDAMCLADLPEPDLFIRTGGEKRISNFLLWQLAYTELYFCDALWPDFDQEYFNEAIAFYNQRERRFGMTSEQLTKAQN